jgi:hypothetical protein
MARNDRVNLVSRSCRRYLQSRSGADLHGRVAGDLLHPSLIRMNGDPGDTHPAALDMDEEQHIEQVTSPRSVSTSAVKKSVRSTARARPPVRLILVERDVL